HTRSKRDWSSDVCSSDLGSGTTTAVLARIAWGRGGAKPLSLSGEQRRRPHPPSGALALGQHDMSPPIGQQLPGSGAASDTRAGEIGRASCREGGGRRERG